jgi:hypothetical protein
MFLIRLIKSLNDAHLEFALAGGYAVALHGAVRGTVDVDIVIATTAESYRKAEAALLGLGLTGRLPVGAKEVFQFRKEYIEKRNLIAWSFVNQKDPSQLVDIIITHDLKKLSTTKVNFQGIKIPILSKKSLIAMKKAAGRPQDIEDIKALEVLDEKD